MYSGSTVPSLIQLLETAQCHAQWQYGALLIQLLETAQCHAQWQYGALTDTVARYISHFDTVTVMPLSVLLSFKTSKRDFVCAGARNPTLQVAAWPYLGTNETSTTWIRGWYDAAWKTRFIHILSCPGFLDRKSCYQPSGVNSADRISSVALHVWTDSCSRHCKGSHTHCALFCCVVFRVETIRNCESRLRLLSCAVLFCLPFILPCSCPSCGPEIA